MRTRSPDGPFAHHVLAAAGCFGAAGIFAFVTFLQVRLIEAPWDGITLVLALLVLGLVYRGCHEVRLARRAAVAANGDTPAGGGPR